MRVATFNTDLHRDGPGLLLRDILRGGDDQIDAVVTVINTVSPDILVLQGVDYDLTLAAMGALNDALGQQGQPYPFLFASRPNTGMRTGLDMDGNRRTAEPRDAQGYGAFSGEGGLAVLSRHPILSEAVQDYSDVLWNDLPDALLPRYEDGTLFPSEEALAIQRLSSTAHWVVPVDVPELGLVHLLTFHAGPPVFDGPEDRNGKRNHDEIMFWRYYLDGAFDPPPRERFILLGGFNNDIDEGEGLKPALRSLLGDPRLQDPVPTSPGSSAASGDPDDTADWDDPDPGNLRVDYILPSTDWTVADSGVYWPTGPEGDVARRASRHRLVWVDLLP